jgi:CrcB protein
LTKFPLGILVVNTAGSFLLGLVIESETNLSFALMGFCGALTTWSAFALDLFEDVSEKNYRSFALNLLSNYGLGVLAAALGIWVAA